MEQRNRFLGLATGTFFIGLALAFWSRQQFHSPLFLPMLFWALAGAALFGTMGPFRLRRRLIALFCVIFFSGLGVLFLPGVSFFSGILVLVGISVIEAAIARTLPMTRSEASIREATEMTSQQPQPVSQPPQNSDAPSYSLYRQVTLPVEGTRQGAQEQAQPKDEWASYGTPPVQDLQALPPQQQ
ncbi:MAG TPA: hypothetical protein VFV38_33965 [Ktedonobacteraceae bacterium]|nr:hypothetical protein [Ktedonobacteraceae bacterium]